VTRPEAGDGAPEAPIGAVEAREVVLVRGGAPASAVERVVVEEPLEIRIASETLAVTMRTPGHDVELATGFLLAEGLIASARDLGRVFHCGKPGDADYGNVIDVLPAPGTTFDLGRLGAARRGTITTAACGVCGRRSIDDLLATCPPLADGARFDAAVVSRLVALVQEQQRVFHATGGSHAAALTTADGRVVVVREDVGRHNAVDKVAGRAVLDGLDTSTMALVVSGRSSFEIVQKAARARVPLVVAVSAPSSLAVDAARRTHVTLVAFARGEAFNIYSGAERITL
jgi:FdhD protein